jgi:hypothetical protein
VYFHAGDAMARRQGAAALASSSNMPMLVVDGPRQLSSKDPVDALGELVLEATLLGAILFIEGVDLIPGLAAAVRQSACGDWSHRCAVILSSDEAPPPPVDRVRDDHAVAFTCPGFAARLGHWERQLDARGVSAASALVADVADRFPLSEPAIEAAAKRFSTGSCLDDPRSLLAAARAEITTVGVVPGVTRIEPRATWSDLVVPPEARDQLRELAQRVAYRHRVVEGWGFKDKTTTGNGVTALFLGAPGTGKTMAAEIVARELALDLLKVDLAALVSKYIGETEKNLERVFRVAESGSALLLFDEADAIFGKRSEIEDAHDRYANQEISYLLQRVERFDGVAILTTNFRQNLDAALCRRLTFAVSFPFPDDQSRKAIWRTVWPGQVVLADDVDLDRLATSFKLSGGHIRNAAMAAAFLAASAGSPVTMAHLQHAISRELGKLGKPSTMHARSDGDNRPTTLLGTARC